MKSKMLNRIRRKWVIALTVVTALGGVSATHAAAAAIPYHSYAINCPKMDYWGNRIKANPIVLNVEDGVGLSYVDGSGIYQPSTKQFVYYRIWAYSYKYGQWYSSPFKRVFMGTPTPAEAYSKTLGVWQTSSSGFDNDDLAVGPNEVSLSPNTGTGTWAIAVQTYWAPRFVTYLTSFLTSPTPASGGVSVLDYAQFTCNF